MTDELLSIKATCRDNNHCLFVGEDIFLDIAITNPGKAEIGFPQAFIQKTGPIIRLIDTRTKADTYLKPNLADLDLRERFTPISSGHTIVLEWMISSDELRQFGHKYVDLSAEITVKADVMSEGKKADFRVTDTLHIVSKDQP